VRSSGGWRRTFLMMRIEALVRSVGTRTAYRENGKFERSARKTTARKDITNRSRKVLVCSTFPVRVGISSPVKPLDDTTEFADDARRTTKGWKTEFESGLTVKTEACGRRWLHLESRQRSILTSAIAGLAVLPFIAPSCDACINCNDWKELIDRPTFADRADRTPVRVGSSHQ
jgi:hypothetical protein